MLGKKGRRASLLKLLKAIWEAPRRSLSRLSHKSIPSPAHNGKTSQASSETDTSPSSDTTEYYSPLPTPVPPALEQQPLLIPKRPPALYCPRPRRILPFVFRRDLLDLRLMEANRRWVQGYSDPEDNFDDEPPLLSNSYSSRVVDLVIHYEKQSGWPYNGPGAAWVAEAKAARQAHDGQTSSAVLQPARAAENQSPQAICYDVLHDKVATPLSLQTMEPNGKTPSNTSQKGSPRRVQELSGRAKASPPKAAYAEEVKLPPTLRSKAQNQENMMACSEVKSTKDAPVSIDALSGDTRDSLATKPGAKLQVNDLTKVTEAQPRQYWLGRLITLVNAFHYEDSFHHPDIATGFSMLSSYSRPLGYASSSPSFYRTKRAFMVLENECVTDEAAASLCEFRDEYILRYGDRWME